MGSQVPPKDDPQQTQCIDSLSLIQMQSGIHVITGVVSSSNYSSDSDDDWLSISNSNIKKDESLVQIQFNRQTPLRQYSMLPRT